MAPLIAKHLLTPVHTKMNDFFYADWNMNLYRGRSHGCIYCDSRPACYQSELRSKRSTGVVTMGSMSDPYNPLEEDLCWTRQAMELLQNMDLAQPIRPSPPCTPGMLCCSSESACELRCVLA